MRGEFGPAAPRKWGDALQPQPGREECGQQTMRSSSGLGWASTTTGELMAPWGRGKPPGSLCGGRWCHRSPAEQWGATQLGQFLLFPKCPYPFTPFLGGLLLNCLVCLCLNLGGPLRGVVGPVGASPVLRLVVGFSLIAGLFCVTGVCHAQIPLSAR